MSIPDWYPLGARDVDTIKNSIQLGHPVVYALWIIGNTGWDSAEHAIPGVTLDAIEAPAQMPATNSLGEPCRCQCGADVKAKDCWCNDEGVCCDPPDPHCARGGHAVLLTGYDDERKAFHMINSWGDDWPSPWEGGMFWLAYDYVEAFGKGGAAIQSVRSCVKGVCTEPSADEDLTAPPDDVKETTDSWVVQKEGVTIELPKETPCLEPGKEVGFCADTWALVGDPHCEDNICPTVFGCHKIDDPDGGQICMCD